ncbi:hypothetical protein EJD97_016568 [Solanum chilense]|uniref:Uncharacterized protein n=1 Tax=Solanum chilense TaxID=4083 RepID=A0A6N2B739_SOLCI|nr:hypothetical protein EJD97_016568 [Solanum chilense]
MNAEILSKECRKVPPTELVTVRRWHHSAAAKRIWGSLTKCGVTKCVTDHRSHDGLSCRFVMKITEVVLVPKFQDIKCYGTDTPDGLLCL